jgi:hypothetical protein
MDRTACTEPHCLYKGALYMYNVIFSVLDPRKYEYLKDYSLDFEYAYMTTIYEYFQHLL